MKRDLSIVIPCFRSEKSLPLVMEAIAQEREKLGCVEVILVNDGSGDRTWAAIETLAQAYPFCRGIDLAKNSGQHNAILAGMACAKGDVIACMDDDLQTHPSQLSRLLECLGEEYDIVYGKFTRRRHSASRNILSRLSELSARFLLDKPAELKACPMFVVRRFVRDEVIRSESAYTNLLGLFLRTTGRIANVPIEHRGRAFGSSGYTAGKLLRLWSSYLNYSMKPLRLVLALGGAMAVVGAGWLLALAIRARLFDNAALAAWMLLLCGIMLLGLGLVGEYLGRMFMIISKEPQYVVRADTGEPNEQQDSDSRSG